MCGDSFQVSVHSRNDNMSLQVKRRFILCNDTCDKQFYSEFELYVISYLFNKIKLMSITFTASKSLMLNMKVRKISNPLEIEFAFCFNLFTVFILVMAVLLAPTKYPCQTIFQPTYVQLVIHLILYACSLFQTRFLSLSATFSVSPLLNLKALTRMGGGGVLDLILLLYSSFFFHLRIELYFSLNFILSQNLHQTRFYGTE